MAIVGIWGGKSSARRATLRDLGRSGPMQPGDASHRERHCLGQIAHGLVRAARRGHLAGHAPEASSPGLAAYRRATDADPLQPRAHNWRAAFHRLEGGLLPPGTIRSYIRSDFAALRGMVHERGGAPLSNRGRNALRVPRRPGRRKVTLNRAAADLCNSQKSIGSWRLPIRPKMRRINLSLRRVKRAKTTRPRQAKGLTKSYLDRFRDTQGPRLS